MLMYRKHLLAIMVAAAFLVLAGIAAFKYMQQIESLVKIQSFNDSRQSQIESYMSAQLASKPAASRIDTRF